MLLTAERLKDLLSYDEETGAFRWRQTKGRAKAGEVAGATDTYGYRVIRIDRVLYKAHRLAWLYTYNRWPVGLLDHINRAPGDNRIANLREVTQSENMHNSSRTTQSGVPGVRWRAERNKWVAQIRVGYRTHVLGSFPTKQEAIDARRKAEQAMLSSIYK
jgi:hypothetical protein